MVLQYGDEFFNKAWLDFAKQDPVHPSIPNYKRVEGNRTVFVYVKDNQPQFMICARIGNKIPKNMDEVLEDDGYSSIYDVSFAIFYSIFRLPNTSQKGIGKIAIKEVIAYCRKKGIANFYTLSPAPLMRAHLITKPDEPSVRRYLASWQGAVAKFHLGNGAKIHSINYDADQSELRLEESWGIMVNYDYCAQN
jgi:malonyl-CoA decarboxylase